MVTITPKKLNESDFSAFGEILDKEGEWLSINCGRTKRSKKLVGVEVINEAGASISFFEGEPSVLPIEIRMMERHPLGSQAFMPLSNRPWLVVVAEDDNGKPAPPQAFYVLGGQGVSYNRNVWHHPLLCLESVSDFLVVDYAGSDNLEEYEYPSPYTLTF